MVVLKAYLTSLIRITLYILFGALVARNWITDRQAKELTESGAEYFATIAITLIIPLISTLYSKIKTKYVIKTAAEAPANVPIEKIKAVAFENMKNDFIGTSTKETKI